MRAKTFYTELPSAYEIKDGDAGQKIICFRQNIEEIETEDGTQYTADEYTLTLTDTPTLEERIANNIDAWREKAMREDYDRVAAEIRAIRDKLLAESDKEMVLDRMGLEVPTGISFSAWIEFLKKLGSAVSGELAKYRQELRDIPQQEGFPYCVVFPTRHKGNSK